MGSLNNIIYDACKRFANLIAVKIGDRLISYEELNLRSLAVANTILEAGIENEAIGLVGQRKPSSYIGILGIQYAGCHYIPLNPKYNKTRLKSVMKDAGIRALVGDVDDMLKLEEILGDSDMPPFVLIPEGISPRDKQWIDVSQIKNQRAISMPKSVEEETLSYILYTSGSTGLPKGVMVTHHNICSFLENMSALYKLQPGFRSSQTFDFSFDPSVSDIFFTWSKGGQLCVLPEEEMMLPADYIRREKIEYWNSVPSLAVFMHKMGQLTPNCFPDIKYSMFCGEQFPKQIADIWQQAAPNSTIENLYGPTEATIYISRYEYRDKDYNMIFKNGIIPIGHPFLNHQVAIVDDNGDKVVQGEIGEICFKGPQVTNGYLHDKEKTTSVFVNFPWGSENETKWYKTGDLGFINANGNVECVGRRDSQIKLGGRRIEIGEIEAVLSRFDKTNGAVVVPLRDDQHIVTGCVAFTLHNLTKQEEIQIRNESASFLEKTFFPKKIVVIEKFPLTISGKIDRKNLEVIAKKSITMH